MARGPLRPRWRPTPEPGPGEVRLRISACGVCRTDLQLVEGDLALHRRPLVPGHQAVGRVEAVGPGVSGLALGDRLGVGWLAGACGGCPACRRGAENLCPRGTFTGWDRDGGYATHQVVAADFTLPLPAAMADEAVAPLLCAGIIGFRAWRLTGLSAGARLGLFGFGSSAHLVCQVARHAGCAVYVSSRGAAARARAERLGAAWVGGPGEQPPVPLDAAITFAPSGRVVVEALVALDRGGICVVNAIHLDGVPVLPYPLLYGERRLQSVANYTRDDARAFLALAARIPIVPEIETHPLAAANQALQRLRAGAVEGSLVLSVGPSS